MFIMPSVIDTSSVLVTSSDGSTFTVKDPETRTTKQIIRIKDGETVILGGLIRTRKSESITKLPILGDIPVIGALFRSRTKDRDEERELLVFLTPHIIKDKKASLAKTNIPNLPKLPQREQDAVSVLDRRAMVNTSLNSLGKQ
jgi:type II secretory pathway component GspD/PulD (secretin)